MPQPPDRAALERLPPDLWAPVIQAAREALHQLDEDRLSPRMRQLRATPTGRLAGGRSRRDLCHLLATDERLWAATEEALGHVDGGERLLRLLEEGELPSQPPTPAPANDDLEERVAELTQREVRLRSRNRELLEQREQAERRADGLEARLGVERRRIEELDEEVARLRAEREELAEQLDAAHDDHTRALERERRHHESELSQLRDELRAHRRRDQERRERERREAERAAREEERAQQEAERHRRPPPTPRARPGRPSRLPPGVAPETTEAAEALLTDGRLVLIDGYNVTKQQHGELPLEQQREWLVRLAGGLAARRKVHPTIVFDGQPAMETGSRPGRWVRVVFSAGRSADDEIVAMVDRLPADEPVIVVTDDRELRDRVRERGADVTPTRNFLGAAT